jgi:hypothetical protein
MKPKTAIVLGAILLVCLFLVVLSGSDLFKPKSQDNDGPKEQDVLKAPPGKIARLVVEGRGQKMVFEKGADKWRLTEPVAGQAESWRVDGIADSLKDLKGTTAQEIDAATSGLDKPVWTVTAMYRADNGKETTQKLLIGRPRPMEADQTYVKLEGGKTTYVVKVDFRGKLDKPVSDFRDGTVLDLKADKVVRVAVAGAQNYELAKRDGRWGIVRPVSAKADAEAVKKVVDKVASLKASEFLPEAPKNLSPFGLDKPALTVEVEMEAEVPASAPSTQASQPAPPPKPGAKHVLEIGAPSRLGDKLYARLRGANEVFTVDKDLQKDLGPALNDLRDKKVVDVLADAVASVELTLPGGKVKLERKDGLWRMTAPIDGPAGADNVKKLLDKVAGLKAAEFKEDAAAAEVYGLASPVGTIVLREAGANDAVTVLVGGRSASGEMTFVKTAAGKSIAVVPTADAAELLAEGATYWDAQILKLPSEEKVAKLELRRTDDTFNLAKDANGGWTLIAPLAAAADKDNVNKIIDRLENLKADKVVALGKMAPDQYAKSPAIMQVVFTTEKPAPTEAASTQPATGPATKPATGPATRPTQPAAKPPIAKAYKLTVAKVGLHSYAWIDGGSIVAVGEFAPTLYDEMAAELRTRPVWTIDPDQIRGLKLTAGEESLELRKMQDAWQSVADPYVKIDAEKVTNYLKDAKDLKADRFVANKSGDEAKYGLNKPWLTLELTDQAGKAMNLTVSHTGATATKDRYAKASTTPGTFTVPAEQIEKLGKKLKDFTK